MLPLQRQGGDGLSWFGTAIACLSPMPPAGGSSNLVLAVGDPFALSSDGIHRVRFRGL